MDKIFNPDNAFFSAVRNFFDMMVLSILWTLLSIPVITAGAASTGLYYAVVKSIRSQRGYPVREFFKGFKRNFFKATCIWMLLLLVGAMFFFSDFPLVMSFIRTGSTVDTLLLILFAVKALLYLGIACLIFPVLSRFEGSVVELFENTLLLCVRSFPRALGAILLFLIGVVLLSAETMFLILVPSGFVWLLSFLLEPVFCRRAMEFEEEESRERDSWYLENGSVSKKFITVLKNPNKKQKREKTGGISNGTD